MLFFCTVLDLLMHKVRRPLVNGANTCPGTMPSTFRQLPEKYTAQHPMRFFTYDLDEGSFSRKSKMNGLSDVGVQAMQYDAVSGKTVIAYKNGNIDVISDDKLINIPDIKISSNAGIKPSTGFSFIMITPI
jgi:hypothetical protein